MSSPELHIPLRELNAIRLEHNWTWAQLSASMTDAELPVSPRTLHYLIKRAGADAHALDRTVYKIKKYVARMKGNAALSKRDRMNGRGVR